MKQPNSFFLGVSLLLVGFVLLSCRTGQQYSKPPSWAVQQENITPLVPSNHPPSSENVVSETNNQDQIPSGVPQNLIQPITGQGKQLHEKNLAARNQRNKINPAFLTTASNLEKLYLGYSPKEYLEELSQFGYDYLSSTISTEINAKVPPRYIIGRGDQIILTLSGTIDAVYKLTVDRDGAISIPDIGVINVQGIRMDELTKHLESSIAEQRKGFTLNVTLGTLKTLQIKITGRIIKPGITEISSLSTPFLALSKAGGIRKDGSLRNILLKRNNTTTVVDLYDYFFDNNNQNSFIQLQEGDQLHVPPIGKTVAITGLVKQSAIYEINTDEITVKQAIDLAGGLTPFSFTPLAYIEKSVEGRGREQINIELTGTDLNKKMNDGELLFIGAVDNQKQPIIEIEGEVTRPGQYAYTKGMKVSDAINAANGLTINAFTEQIFISRQIGQNANISYSPSRSTYLQNRQILVIDWNAVLSGDNNQDILLQPLDYMTVRPKHLAQSPLSVEVLGAVQQPGIYELTVGMRVSDLIAIAGNPTPTVYYDEAELIRKIFDEQDRRMNVKRFRINLRQALSASDDSSQNPLLQNGDQLIIRNLQQSQVRVKISGRVRFPGEYVFPAGTKIDQLVQAAGGILADADLRAAKFTRKSTRDLQLNSLNDLTERIRRLYERNFERAVNNSNSSQSLANKLAIEQSMQTLQRMKTSDVTGRIVIPFTDSNFLQSDYNLVLENGDALDIPTTHQTVSVVGHVFRPITLVAKTGYSVREALSQAGGLTEDADRGSLYIIRADGSVENLRGKKYFLRKSLLAGDVLLVPRKPIEKSLGSSLSEAILLARQAAEMALLSSQIGTNIDASFVSPINYSEGNLDAEILEEVK